MNYKEFKLTLNETSDYIKKAKKNFDEWDDSYEGSYKGFKYLISTDGKFWGFILQDLESFPQMGKLEYSYSTKKQTLSRLKSFIDKKTKK